MRVLVTGGAGFIGSHVVTALAAAGHEVSSMDSLHPAARNRQERGQTAPPQAPAPWPDGLARPAGDNGDVRDAGAVAKALRGVDIVVHHAAMVGMGVGLEDLPEYVSRNDLGTAVLLAGMARSATCRLVLASSMVVYGEGAYTCRRDGPVRPASRVPGDLAAGRFEPACPRCGRALAPALVTEAATLDPRSGYAATKVAQEHLAGVWARETGGAAIALRYHNVYGPGMPRDTPYAGVAAIFRSSLERTRSPRLFEDGAQLRDFVHVTDVARANVKAVDALAEGTPPGLTTYNIASGEPHTIADLAEALAEAFGGPAPVVTGEFRAGDVRHIMADPALARARLGFRAVTPFRVGMTELAAAPPRA
jgi:dTDP-L-rhamnose 4-epimerase